MTRLYAMDVTALPADAVHRLPEERKQRVLNCRDAQTRAQLTGAGLLLQYALEQTGVPVQEQVFARTEQGKPYLKNLPQVQFSLSHADRWAVCAVSDRPVGVDVELPRCSMDLARRFFAPEEVESLEQLAPAAQTDTLCRLWTEKEAIGKMRGTGLTGGLSRFAVGLTEPGYRLHQYRLGDCRVCLCAADDAPELTLYEAKQQFG